MEIGSGGSSVLPTYDEVRVQHAFHGGRALLAVILGLGVVQGRMADAGVWGILVIATAVVALILAACHVFDRRSNRASTLPEWLFVALDTVLALGLVTLMSDGAAPMAWVALVVPVAEAALAYNMATAIGVWSAIGLCHLAWTFERAGGAGVRQESLASSLQQLLAILILAIPASLLAGSFRNKLRQLESVNELANRDAHALRLVGGRVGQMSAMRSPVEVLTSCAEGAVELGFVAAEVLVPDADGWRLLAARHPDAHPIVSPEVLSAEASLSNGFAELLPDTDRNRQELHLYRAGFGRAVLLDTEGEHGRPVLRVWSAPNSTPADHNLETLALLATQTANVHDTVKAAVLVKRRTEELAFQAAHDPLTSLVNHRTIINVLEDQATDDRALSLLFIDLDGFKPINDTHGHEAGDQALVVVAERLKRVVGDRGLVGRLGGDEFVVIGHSARLASPTHPFGIALQILDAIREPVSINGVALQLSASIGAAEHARGRTGGDLLKRADEAMYEAKQAGTGFCIWGAKSSAELQTSEPVR